MQKCSLCGGKVVNGRCEDCGMPIPPENRYTPAQRNQPRPQYRRERLAAPDGADGTAQACPKPPGGARCPAPAPPPADGKPAHGTEAGQPVDRMDHCHCDHPQLFLGGNLLPDVLTKTKRRTVARPSAFSGGMAVSSVFCRRIPARGESRPSGHRTGRGSGSGRRRSWPWPGRCGFRSSVRRLPPPRRPGPAPAP